MCPQASIELDSMFVTLAVVGRVTGSIGGPHVLAYDFSSSNPKVLKDILLIEGHVPPHAALIPSCSLPKGDN